MTSRSVAPPTTFIGAFVSLGKATGEAFELQLLADAPVSVVADGLVLEAVAEADQDRVRKQFDSVTRARGSKAPAPAIAKVEAFCLDYHKPPPAAGTIFRIADAATQLESGAARRILQAVARLERQDGRRFGGDAEVKRQVTQWALWANALGLSREDFIREFTDHARKNFEAARVPFTSAVAADIARLAPLRFDDVTAVIREARTSTQPRGVR